MGVALLAAPAIPIPSPTQHRSRRKHRWSLLPGVQRTTPQFQLFPVHLLAFVTQQLVHQHAAEHRHQHPGHGQSKHGPQTRIQCPVNDSTIGRRIEHEAHVVVNSLGLFVRRHGVARAGAGLLRVFALAKYLQTAHVEYGRGDGDQGTGQGGSQPARAGQFDQVTVSIPPPG
uniref:(northern house mosquito) hypothetical protein n=1 Tax=Culex pipiens TaxID=7175 RepID=A0A8D8MMW9_CULPI